MSIFVFSITLLIIRLYLSSLNSWTAAFEQHVEGVGVLSASSHLSIFVVVVVIDDIRLIDLSLLRAFV